MKGGGVIAMTKKRRGENYGRRNKERDHRFNGLNETESSRDDSTQTYLQAI